MTNTTVGILQP